MYLLTTAPTAPEYDILRTNYLLCVRTSFTTLPLYTVSNEKTTGCVEASGSCVLRGAPCEGSKTEKNTATLRNPAILRHGTTRVRWRPLVCVAVVFYLVF